jgi:hypothetical protein
MRRLLFPMRRRGGMSASKTQALTQLRRTQFLHVRMSPINQTEDKVLSFSAKPRFISIHLAIHILKPIRFILLHAIGTPKNVLGILVLATRAI